MPGDFMYSEGGIDAMYGEGGADDINSGPGDDEVWGGGGGLSEVVECGTDTMSDFVGGTSSTSITGCEGYDDAHVLSVVMR
jgi:hypothetical protein